MPARSPSAVIVLLAVLAAHPVAAADIPPGFQERAYVEGLVEPTGMAWGPSGELWIAGKRGHVWVFQGGSRTLVGQLPVASRGEEGIEGIAVDPDYATNQFVWIYYTRSEPKPYRNVLSRYRHVGDQLVEERVVLQGPQVTDEVHNGGCLRFAEDKTLFVSVGDDNQPMRAQDKTNLRGKILHLNQDGTPHADNPFRNGGGNPYIWAMGFRNPWRFNIQPGTGALFVGDVGKARFEEVDIAIRGGNFGWPLVEGPEPGGVPDVIYPIYSYPHPSVAQGAAITGGDHVRGTSFPADYQGNYFFGDSTKGWIRRMVLGPANEVLSVSDWATKLPRVVDIQFGSSGALYYVAYDTGKVMEISYVGGSNRQPVAAATVDPDEGNAPLHVDFDASASSDGDGDPLSFLWDFGDGTTATTATATHTYPRGEWKARLTVNDGQGGRGRFGDVRIVSGNNRPRAEITAPANEARYQVGDRIRYAGKGVDPEEGTIPCSQFSWTVVLHHNDHTHPFLGPLQGACSGSFVTVNHGESGVFFEVRLTVSDRGGSLGKPGVLSGTQSVVVRPQGAASGRRLRP
jgi:glucose/arabinose dehydrogenase/chitodextrinase